MPVVETFCRPMLERYLRDHGLRFTVDSDGDLRVAYNRDPDSGRELTCYYCTAGPEREILSIIIFSDLTLPRSEIGRAMFAVNQWNRERRWPCAHVDFEPGEPEGHVTLDYAVDLESGIHQDLLNTVCDRVRFGAFAFWEWAKKEHGL